MVFSFEAFRLQFCIHIISSMCATCRAHVISLNVITVTVLVEEFKLRSYSLWYVFLFCCPNIISIIPLERGVKLVISIKRYVEL
jgi:hypothetical protein